jgi:hypothetical protein
MHLQNINVRERYFVILGTLVNIGENPTGQLWSECSSGLTEIHLLRVPLTEVSNNWSI